VSALQSSIYAQLAIQAFGTTPNLGYLQFVSSAPVGRDKHADAWIVVTTGTTDQAVNLEGMTTVIDLMAISDQVISLKINGSATETPGTVFLISGTDITSLAITNASGQTANVQIVMAGS
jgi:hypothetical protein